MKSSSPKLVLDGGFWPVPLCLEADGVGERAKAALDFPPKFRSARWEEDEGFEEGRAMSDWAEFVVCGSEWVAGSKSYSTYTPR